MLQTEAALAVDAFRVMYRGVERLHASNPTAFKHTIKNGKFYNNGTEGINCDAEPVAVWRHGYELMKVMREVHSYVSCVKLFFMSPLRAATYIRLLHGKIGFLEGFFGPSSVKRGRTHIVLG